jgi:rhodanese-related sulfurtransferase
VSELEQISREELWERIQRRESFVLVDALSPMSYAAAHLPGSVNIPPESVDDRAPALIPGLETPIVVYCVNAECDASVRVGSRLLELGYRNVAHYAGGKSAWADAGLPLEGGRV